MFDIMVDIVDTFLNGLPPEKTSSSVDIYIKQKTNIFSSYPKVINISIKENNTKPLWRLFFCFSTAYLWVGVFRAKVMVFQSRWKIHNDVYKNSSFLSFEWKAGNSSCLEVPHTYTPPPNGLKKTKSWKETWVSVTVTWQRQRNIHKNQTHELSRFKF